MSKKIGLILLPFSLKGTCSEWKLSGSEDAGLMLERERLIMKKVVDED